ncbi:sacsin-like [Corticium candelabrum]|uniref:sacsin-like n=1 Tax=Corticium candelabrum TaxID=121492 RepID=UPI002E265E80|nr:sacsin-like [Corticium candelabrum]
MSETDLPSVVSGKKIGFFDPHQKHFQVLDCDLSKSSYNGTLFRFPLRQKPSPNLSSSVYNSQRIHDLFKSFQADAHLVLLFLKTVEVISIYEWLPDRPSAHEVFKVCLSEPTKTDAIKIRRRLLSNISAATTVGKLKKEFVLAQFYEADIMCTSRKGRPITQRWLVENYISTKNPQVHSMAEKVAQIPWVGLAVPIGDKTEHSKNLGRIFCFLPLPPSDDADSNTGLPVHVHGSFSVADNRRSLKWPAEDRAKDEKAEWNCLLAQHLITQAYASLIQHAIKLDRGIVSVADIYAMWPDSSHVEYHWLNYVIKSLLRYLSEHKVLYGVSELGESWESVTSVLICDKVEKALAPNELVAVQEMQRIGHKVAFPTANVASCLAQIEREYSVRGTVICPGVVGRQLRESKHRYEKLDPHDKILLLKYMLKKYTYESLIGLRLLPLADGTFTTFLHPSSRPVYLDSLQSPRSLFPGQNAKFLHQKTDIVVDKALREVAAGHGTQLKEIQPSDVPSLVSEVLSPIQNTWSSAMNCRPEEIEGRSTDCWIAELWKWINQNVSNVSLKKFEYMFIVPVTSTSGVKKLMKLVSGLPAIFAELRHSDVRISKDLAEGLEGLGCTVLYNSPKYLVSCSELWSAYICQPVQILRCISRVSDAISKCHLLSQAQRCELLIIVASAVQVSRPAHEEINVLKFLPVFREWGGKNLESLSHCNQIAPAELKETLPIINATLIANPDLETNQILRFLSRNSNYYQLTLEQVFMKFVFSQFQVYLTDAKEKLIKFALDNVHFMSVKACQTMASLAFIQTGDGQLKSPNAVFNPNERYVSELYGDQRVFPTGPFALKTRYGNLLSRHVGFRKLSDITANELCQLAEHVAITKSKSMAKILLKLLTKEEWAQQLLQRKFEGKRKSGRVKCCEALANVPWMPVIECCSSFYPIDMPWTGSCSIALPRNVAVPFDDVTSGRLQLLVGSQLAILDHTSTVSQKVAQLLLCASSTNVYEAVIRQLTEAHRLWKANSVAESSHAKFDKMLQELFCTLGSAFNSSNSLAKVIRQGLKTAPDDWVWLDGLQGFTMPKQLVVSSAIPVLLEPWVYKIDQYRHLSNCIELLQMSGMKSNFEDEDIILSVLSAMKVLYDSAMPKLEHKKMERDLELTITILNWLTRDQAILSQNLQQRLLVPVDREDNILELCPCSDLMYCDAEWLRHGGDLEVAQYRLIHKQISSETAFKLGVPSLSNRLAPSEELPFEQLGPHESLTLRLKNILKEYKDDVGIFKELLQNADDAGATSVKFLIDWREHDKFSLLAPEMSKCQGPALWAFNDSVFSDEDFVNISKLAAATKQSKLEKIGRFGLGFTSVYHMTDVPSFVSRQFVVIFDPHKRHLGSHIRNPSQPGIKIDFVQRPIGQRFPDQFQPYADVFGCKLVEGVSFDGTLFRFPFRTKEQAAVNEIKNEPYDEDQLKTSLQALKEVCGKLLIFLQHVRSVEVFELKSDAVSPSEMKQILSVAQTEAESFGSHQQMLMSSCSQLQTGYFQRLSGSVSNCEIKWHDLTDKEVNTANWLVCSQGSNGDAFQFSSKHWGQKRGFVPFAQVAVLLRENYLPYSIDGETFCFLPLSEKTGLPLHVNGTFAVLSNRRGIWWHGTEETRIGGKTDVEAEWNEKLINDCLVQSYISTLKHLSERLDYRDKPEFLSHYYALWPKQANLSHAVWETLAFQFYKEVINGSDKLVCSMSTDGFKWISLRDCAILSNSVKKMLPHAEHIMKQVCPSYVELPKHVWDGLHRANSNIMENVTVEEEQFLLKWFAPHVQKMNFEIRDDLLKILLTRVLTTGHLISCLSNLAIFPCCPDGQMLRTASDMIDPNCDEAELFDREESRFPVEELCQRDELVLALKKLGMKSTGSFTWSDVVERSATVRSLEKANHARAKRRIRALIKLIDSLCKKPERCSTDQLELLRNTPFLLVESRPRDYPIVWYADHCDERVVTPVEGYVWRCRYGVGSQAYIIDSSLQAAVIDLLGLSSSPPLTMLIMQLDLVIAAFQEIGTKTSFLMEIIDMLYKDLQRRYDEDEAGDIVTALDGKAWIVVEDHAMKSDQLAFEWRKSAPPYLSSVPSELLHMKRLLEGTGVHKVFQPLDFVIALQQICAAENGERLRVPLVSYVEQLIIPEFASLTENELITFRGNLEVPLLSEDGRLIPASRLAYNDAPWMDSYLIEKHVYVHSCVPRITAQRLGVKLVRDTVLDSYACDIPGMEFGQHEPLTKRLQNILDEYPADEGILKELVQNADDAKATEIHVIFDQRQYKTQRVLSDEWESLQGPAICVYNNRPFTKEDIKGIQDLGRGSKGDDPSLTGRYGIGFNAVYHLTDCPSFLSDNKTLCVLDPHCRYVFGATKEKPGRMFDTDESFWKKFCDIRDCYRPIVGITLGGGTLFRFPLRTKAMADISEVSKNVFDTERVQTLMKTFKQSAPSMLLFLSNVSCIKLTSISKNSQVISSYEVKADLSSRAEEERQKMSKIVADNKSRLTSEIEYADVFYELNIRVIERLENSDRTQNAPMEGKWLVQQSIGVLHRNESKFAVEGRGMSLLPLVGIAAPLRSRLRPKQSNLFYFLPLPVCWELPVQINGHFALDSRRRGLWVDSNQSHVAVKHKWNEELIRLVLVPAYALFVLQARDYVTVSGGGGTGKPSLRESLNWFYHLLPRYIGKRTELAYLEILLKEFYIYIVEHNLPLLAYTGQPAVSVCEYVKDTSESQKKLLKDIIPVESGDDEVTSVKWLQIGKKTDIGTLTGYFSPFTDGRQDTYALEVVLLRIGFPVVLSPPSLRYDILKANEGANVDFVSPRAVYLFLRNYRTAGSCCRLQCDSLEKTSLTIRAANLVLEYVLVETKESITKCDKEFDTTCDTKSGTSYLSGLPLLITADCRLCEFSTSRTVYVSRYSDLLPKGPHLFVHKELIGTLEYLEDLALRELSPDELVRQLPEQDVFPLDWLVSDEYKGWDSSASNRTCVSSDVGNDSAVGPSKQWIKRLWSYLKTYDCNVALKALEKIPIISVDGGKMLVPPILSHTVLLPMHSNLFPGLRQVLLGLGAVEVDDVVTESLFRAADIELPSRFSSKKSHSNVFANIDNPVSIVKVLQYLYKSRQAQLLSIGNVNIILKYFQNSSINSSDAAGLKGLPLFETVEGILTEIASSKWAYTLPRELPSCGSRVWMTEARCIFLRQQDVFDKIYEKLGLNSKTSEEVYMRYILPCFPRMSQDDRIVHLVFIMMRFENSETLIEKLKSTACFDKHGRPEKIGELYDPSVALFRKMLLSEEFPPIPLESVLSTDLQYKWLPFLVRLGLKTVCPHLKFLELAKGLELEASKWTLSGRKPAGYKNWKERSKEMQYHLIHCMNKSWCDPNFTAAVTEIRFLPSKKVNEQLRDLAAPFYERNTASSYATSYSKGVLYSRNNEMLCWTSQALLDVEYIQNQRQRAQFQTELRINMQPKLDDVVIHFRLLVEQAKTVVYPSCQVDDDVVKLLSNVLSAIFSHFTNIVSGKPLQELPPFADLRYMKSLSADLFADGCRVVEFLSFYSSIFIPDKQVFVKPQQVVFSLEHRLYPYLFQLPRDFVCHHLLLRRIGVDEKPRAFHCARILETIKTRYRDDKVDSASDWTVMVSIVRLLFETLNAVTGPSLQQSPVQNDSFSTDAVEMALTPLYLPSRDGVLFPAADLVYLDRIHLENHLVHFGQYNFLIDLVTCGLSSLEEETIDLLPSRLRPQKLSHLTEEVLDPDCLLVTDNKEEEQEQLATMYQRRFSAPFFAAGIRSIFIYEARTRRIPDEVETGLSLLQTCFRVRCLPEIRTCLKSRSGEDMIKLEGVQKCCFLEQTESEVTLYVESNSAAEGKTTDADTRFHGLIARELQSFLRTKLLEFPLIMIVLCKYWASIPKVLKSLNIPFVDEDDLALNTTETVEFYPGMELLSSHLALLHKSDFYHRFNIDEWVAYEVEENRFIYAIVVYREYNPDEARSELTTRYGIYVGEEEPKIVSILSLYAFTDKDEFQHQQERSLVLTESSSLLDASSDIDASATLENKKDAVRKLLNEIWKLSNEDRRKAIKRLYLRWHPDKTDDRDGEEVFKFIKIEVDRLERGEPQYTGGSSYSNYYSNWDSYATRYSRSYRNSSSFTYHPPPCSSYRHLVRNERLGFLFVQQAEADLSAAEALFRTEDSDERRFATVCFLCHEAVEKSLKGLLYIKRGIPEEDRHKHYFRFFLGAAGLPGCPPTLEEFVSMVSDSHYLDTRYPDRHDVVPATQFSRETAQHSLRGARGVVADTLTFAEDNS